MMNTNFMNGMFGKIAPGMCKLSMSGGIAVKTSNGYKSYNVKSGRLTNCSNFVFGNTEEFFFVIPTNKVEVGDIILIAGKPKCVIEVAKNKITVINYEDATIDTVIPERHVFMGNTYFYGKIVSMFGNDFKGGKKGMNKMMSYMMMSEFMKGNGGMSANNNSMLPMMLMMNGGGFTNMFEGMFDFDEADEETEDETEENEEV
jgi:hypothetical protein